MANFPWMEPPDAAELARAESSLKSKAALDDEGRLTAHGLELTGFQSEPRLANLMIVADRMACAVEMATVLAVLKVGYGKLFVKNKEWDEVTAKRVQEVQATLAGPCADDLEVALKVLAGWELARPAGQTLASLWAWQDAWDQVAERHQGRRLRAAERGTARGSARPTKPARDPCRARVGKDGAVEVIDRAAGARAGVRVVGSEAEATMTPRDFGFRDDYAVTDAVLAEWGKAKALTFRAAVWEVVPDDGILRLTTFPQIEAWRTAYPSPPTSGTLVRSNPANPDRVSVLLHLDPANDRVIADDGLVFAADASGAHFGGVSSGATVQVRVSRPRDARRFPDIRRARELPAGADEWGLVALPEAGKTRYERSDAMSVAARTALIAIAPADQWYRALVDELFEQSNGLYAEAAAAAGDDLAGDIGQELIGRVVEVNSAGARLEAADASHPAAALVEQEGVPRGRHRPVRGGRGVRRPADRRRAGGRPVERHPAAAAGLARRGHPGRGRHAEGKR